MRNRIILCYFNIFSLARLNSKFTILPFFKIYQLKSYVMHFGISIHRPFGRIPSKALPCRLRYFKSSEVLRKSGTVPVIALSLRSRVSLNVNSVSHLSKYNKSTNSTHRLIIQTYLNQRTQTNLESSL